jgi:molecular chaperone DnaJ
MQTVVVCPTCQGEGSTISAKCTTCKGDGRSYDEETVSINIPGGVYDGMQLSMSGKGNAGMRGGAPGDLIIAIEEEAHKELHRDGLNVGYDLFISFTDAVFGAQVEVPTIDGRAKIKIPPGTQSGKIFRLKGKGFPEINGYGRKGDQLINVNVWTPQNLSTEEKAVLEAMRESENFQPHPSKSEKGFFDKLKEVFS